MSGRVVGRAASADRVTCRAEIAHLPVLLALVTTVCERERVDTDAMHDLQLIAEEACVNVMRHAYAHGQPGVLSLSIEVRSGPADAARTVLLTLEDQGRPFNPLGVAPVDTAASAERREIGGLGVHLIRRLSHGQHYQWDPQRGNVLTIERRLALPSSS